MPNWCSTDFRIVRQESDGGIKPLYDFIKKDMYEKCNGRLWLGDLVEKGLDTDPAKGKYLCRGHIYDVSLYSDEEICICTETAWEPSTELFFDLCKKFVPGATVYYIAEEPGCGVYCTNDPDYEGKYCVDSRNDKVESIGDASEKDVRGIVAKVTGKNAETGDIDSILRFLDEDDYDLSINPWNYEPEQPNYEESV